jgi:tetratricopeptide (TPR) repeat protein
VISGAKLFESIGQYQKAMADWTYLIGVYPKNPYYLLNRAQDKVALGQYKEALADYDLAVKVDPKDDHCYFLRGKLKLKLGQFLAAAEDFSSSIKLDDEPSWTIYKLRAEAYEKGGKAELGKADRLKAARMEQL